MEVDDKEDGYKAQVAKLQREAEALVAQLRQQGSGMEAVRGRRGGGIVRTQVWLLYLLVATELTLHIR